MTKKFQVGDVVRVVDKPYKRCPFGWVADMDHLCGKYVTIASVYWSDYRNTFAYYLEEDDYSFKWCENCFVEEETEIEESDVDISTLFV